LIVVTITIHFMLVLFRQYGTRFGAFVSV